MIDEPRVKKLKELLNLVSEGLTKEEFLKAFQAILDVVLRIEKKQDDKFETNLKGLKKQIENAIGGKEEDYEDLKKQTIAALNKVLHEQEIGMNLIRDKVRNIKEGIDGIDVVNGKDGKDGASGKDGKDGSPDKPEEIRNKLESLEDDEKLPIKAIKDLQEELDKLRKQKGNIIYAGGSTGGGKIVKSYDLSSLLNGVLKTFSLPAFYRVISVHTSSFPNTLRATTDYTTNASAMTITFTSEIDAGTVLAGGQTVTVVYSE